MTLTLPVTLTFVVVIYTTLGGSQRSCQWHFSNDIFRFPSTKSRFPFDSDSFTSVSSRGNHDPSMTFKELDGDGTTAGAGKRPEMPLRLQSLDFPFRDAHDHDDDDIETYNGFLPFPMRIRDLELLEEIFFNLKSQHEVANCLSPLGKPAECLPMIFCVSDFDTIEDLSSAFCHLPNGSLGLCCHHEYNDGEFLSFFSYLNSLMFFLYGRSHIQR